MAHRFVMKHTQTGDVFDCMLVDAPIITVHRESGTWNGRVLSYEVQCDSDSDGQFTSTVSFLRELINTYNGVIKERNDLEDQLKALQAE